MRFTPILIVLTSLSFGQERRPLKVEDVHSQCTVADPHMSPDGQWAAYTVTTAGREGSERVRLTSSKENETALRWSPDGKWLTEPLNEPNGGWRSEERRVGKECRL